MTAKNNIWTPDPGVDLDTLGLARMRFLAQCEGEAVTLAATHTLDAESTLEVADVIAGALEPRGVISSLDAYEIVIQFDGAQASVQKQRNHRGKNNSGVAEFTIEAAGPRELGQRVLDAVKAAYGNKRYTEIKWWFLSDHGTETQSIYLPPVKTTLRPEFYPDMQNPQKFLESYLAADASILLLAGPPGTGKTTLLRHLISDHSMKAHIVYDERLMNSDTVFQSFLFGDGDIMIIEDADAILTSRENENNKLMARFLNVSDGLIKLPNKKLVFTTNISDFGRVDSALLRPGRCFAVLHTRPLNLDEAQAACRVASLPIPVERGEYTLAELFNQTTKPSNVRTIGFAQGRARS